MKKRAVFAVFLMMVLSFAMGVAQLRIIAPTDGSEIFAEPGGRVNAFKFSWAGAEGPVEAYFYEDNGGDAESGTLVTWFVSSWSDTYMNVHVNSFRDGQNYVGVFKDGTDRTEVHFTARSKVSSLVLATPDPDQLAFGVWELDASSISFLAWYGAKEYMGTTWSILSESGEVLAGGTTEPEEEEVVVDRKNLDDCMNVVIRLQQGDDSVDYHVRTSWVNLMPGKTIEDAKAMSGMGVVTVKEGKSVNVRATPNQKGTLVGRAAGGERLLKLSVASNGWVEVRLVDGRTGYISPKLLEGE